MIQIDDSGLIELCRKLIQTPSVSGQEKNIADAVKKEMNALNFDQAWIDHFGNVIGKIKGNGPKKILFDAHIDTVPVNDVKLWSYPPFDGEVDHGRIYGRGASDMKGSLAAMIYAAKELVREKENLGGDLYISGTVFEETLEGVSFEKVLEKIDPDFVVIGEASELNLKIGQRGRGEILVETEGKNAHSANPQLGYNAVYAMVKLINQIQELKLPRHSFLGEAILELTDIISLPYPGASVVPNVCKATFDRRLLVDESKEEVLAPIKELIRNIQQADPDYKATVRYAFGKEVTYTGETVEGEKFFPAWLMDEESTIVQKSIRALEKLGKTPEITKYSFCTNGSRSAGMRNIPTIGFGPSREGLAHVVDEYVEIEELKTAAAGYYYLAKELLADEI